MAYERLQPDGPERQPRARSRMQWLGAVVVVALCVAVGVAVVVHFGAGEGSTASSSSSSTTSASTLARPAFGNCHPALAVADIGPPPKADENGNVHVQYSVSHTDEVGKVTVAEVNVTHHQSLIALHANVNVTNVACSDTQLTVNFNSSAGASLFANQYVELGSSTEAEGRLDIMLNSEWGCSEHIRRVNAVPVVSGASVTMQTTNVTLGDVLEHAHIHFSSGTASQQGPNVFHNNTHVLDDTDQEASRGRRRRGNIEGWLSSTSTDAANSTLNDLKHMQDGDVLVKNRELKSDWELGPVHNGMANSQLPNTTSEQEAIYAVDVEFGLSVSDYKIVDFKMAFSGNMSMLSKAHLNSTMGYEKRSMQKAFSQHSNGYYVPVGAISIPITVQSSLYIGYDAGFDGATSIDGQTVLGGHVSVGCKYSEDNGFRWIHSHTLAPYHDFTANTKSTAALRLFTAASIFYQAAYVGTYQITQAVTSTIRVNATENAGSGCDLWFGVDDLYTNVAGVDISFRDNDWGIFDKDRHGKRFPRSTWRSTTCLPRGGGRSMAGTLPSFKDDSSADQHHAVTEEMADKTKPVGFTTADPSTEGTMATATVGGPTTARATGPNTANPGNKDTTPADISVDDGDDGIGGGIGGGGGGGGDVADELARQEEQHSTHEQQHSTNEQQRTREEQQRSSQAVAFTQQQTTQHQQEAPAGDHTTPFSFNTNAAERAIQEKVSAMTAAANDVKFGDPTSPGSWSPGAEHGDTEDGIAPDQTGPASDWSRRTEPSYVESGDPTATQPTQAAQTTRTDGNGSF